MADYREFLTGAPTAFATTVYAGTAPQLLHAADSQRISLTVQTIGAGGLVGIATNFTATSNAIQSIPAADGSFEERDYKGAVYGRTEGATAGFRVWKV